ncbi:hypothetical protein LX73_1170 [Fodinibius salinus]|uniref:Uncharacterized protein n=2 Tax=Fodinibius salinus TaxID=860790 RepID=A0A5D3YKI0_9BACT|nr:hypothetical protein LX73_1170 [Fodinibius salinus]
MTIENLKNTVLIILSSALILGYVSSNNTGTTAKESENLKVTEDIRLYSNGKLVGQWEGIGRGQLEGNTYTFKTERGTFSNEVRISGDFVIKTNTN